MPRLDALSAIMIADYVLKPGPHPRPGGPAPDFSKPTSMSRSIRTLCKHALGKDVDVEDKVWSKTGKRKGKMVDLKKFRKLAIAPAEVDEVLQQAQQAQDLVVDEINARAEAADAFVCQVLTLLLEVIGVSVPSSWKGSGKARWSPSEGNHVDLFDLRRHYIDAAQVLEEGKLAHFIEVAVARRAARRATATATSPRGAQPQRRIPIEKKRDRKGTDASLGVYGREYKARKREPRR